MNEFGWIVFWISAPIGLIAGTWSTLSDGEGFWQWIGRSLVFFVVAFFVVLIIGGIVGHFLGENQPTYEAAYHRSDLKALKDNRDVHGSMNMVFFVGSGYIDTDLYYYFHHRSETGNWQFKKVWAETSYPRIEIEECDCKPQYIRYGTFYKNKDKWYTKQYMINETRDVLRVPKGTIYLILMLI